MAEFVSDSTKCSASPDHTDILDTIQNAADDWQKQGYTTALAEVRDMANVGRALMTAIADNAGSPPLKGWHPADCPSEIVSDLLNLLDDATRAAPPATDREAVDRDELAKRLFWADVLLGDHPERLQPEWRDRWWDEISTMPLSGPGFLRKWRALADAALSTLSADAIRQGEGWQPISDADTSQERLTVLGYGTFRGRSHPQVVVLDWVKWIGSWSAYTMPFEPTHWMPLPDAPASHASDGGKADV